MAAEAEEESRTPAGVAAEQRFPSMREAGSRPAILLILTIALLTRVVIWSQVGGSSVLQQHRGASTDMHFFDAWGHRIAAGDLLGTDVFPEDAPWDLAAARYAFDRELHSTPFDIAAAHDIWRRWTKRAFFQDPGYAYFLGALYALGAKTTFVLVLQSLLGLLVPLLVWWITGRLAGPRAALFAGLLSAAYGPQLLFELLLLRDFLLALVGLVLIAVFLRALERMTPVLWLLFGFTSGVAVLLKSSLLLLFAMNLALIVGIALRERWTKQALTSAGLILLGFFVALSPLVVRNLLASAPPFAVAGLGAKTFISDNAADYEPRLGAFESHFTPEIMTRTGGALIASARAAIATHASTIAWFAMCLKKVALFLHWYEMPNNENFYLFAALAPAVRFGFRFSLIAALAIPAIILIRNRTAAVLVTYVLFGLIVTFLFANLSRFRLPFAVALIPFAGAFVDWLITRVTTRDWRAAAMGIIGVIVSMAVLLRPLPDGDALIRPFDYFRSTSVARDLASAHVREGDPQMALRVLDVELRGEPSLAQLRSPVWPSNLEDPRVRIEIADSYATLHRLAAVLARHDGDATAVVEHTKAADALQEAARTSADRH